MKKWLVFVMFVIIILKLVMFGSIVWMKGKVCMGMVVVIMGWMCIVFVVLFIVELSFVRGI